MCGLVVTVAFDGRPADRDVLKRSSDVLRHRGPDDSGIATYGPVGFGFRRLSIIDLSPAGHQPMESPDGRLAIVFNGEIYNYLELKEELLQLGHTFQSSSDTEVLLHAYDAWGADCVNHFNGMWAFAIYDKPKGRVFASRDRFGVKPLYRWTDGARIILASEIKAILASGWCPPRVNWSTASTFLGRGHLDEDTQTFYTGIEQLPAGSTLEIDLTGRTEARRFWSIAKLHDAPPEEPVAVFRALFEDAVRLRMRSDVPVGVCLSGGIDSSAIISMMADLRRGVAAYPLQAFSYIPEEFSEAEYINESITRTGAVLNTLQTSPQELWDILPKAMWHYDEPVHSPTALIGYQLMRLAKQQGVTVVLNGQGADEVNAGYHAYFRAHWSDLLHAGRWTTAIREIRAYGRANAQPYGPLLRSALNHWLRTEARRVPGFALVRQPLAGKPSGDLSWLTPELLQVMPPGNIDAWTKPLPDTLEHSVERRPLPLYLRVEDRNAMAHSVEARLPFLDYRLVSLAFSLPSEWKLRGGFNKYLVREALKGVIAEPVRTRTDKMGFPTPSKDWWSGVWFEPMMDLLGSRRLRESGVCKPETARADLQRHARGQIDVSRQLFRLAEFATWMEVTRADGATVPGNAGGAEPAAALAGSLSSGDHHA